MEEIPEIRDIVNNSYTFFKEILNIANNDNLSYIDAVVHYCEKNEIELEVAAKLIKGNSTLKTLLENEGQSLNFLKKTAKLPL